MKILAILLLTLSAAFSQEYWDYVPGVHNYVQNVYVDEANPDLIIVAADSIPIDKDFKDLFPNYYELLTGQGLCISRDGGETFSEYPTLDSSIALQVIRSRTNPDRLIASVANRNSGQFAYSTDEGASWVVEDSDCGSSPKIMDMVALEDRVVGGGVSTGNGFFYSFDDFVDCTNDKTLNVSVRDLDEQDGILWMSSDNNAQSGVYRSENLGNTWEKNESGLQALRVHCVDASGVYQKWGVAHCGADQLLENEYQGRGIFITRDNGVSWSPVGAEGCIVYDIEHHPKYPLFMAAACGVDGIYISTNGGTSWEQGYNNGLPDGADVRLVDIPNLEIDNGYVFYAGVFGEGLFRSKNVMPELTNVDEAVRNDGLEMLNTYPNPVIDNVSVNINAEKAGNYDVELISVSGASILDNVRTLAGGVNTLNFKISDSIPNGMYLLVISNGNQSITSNIVIKR